MCLVGKSVDNPRCCGVCCLVAVWSGQESFIWAVICAMIWLQGADFMGNLDCFTKTSYF